MRPRFIIVGGGSAGCVLAKRLSANRANSVVLIEAGLDDDYLPIHVPIGYLYCIGNQRTDWRHKTAVERMLNGRSLDYPRGKGLGGCSSVNGMIYMRGQQQDYAGWAEQLGDASWTWESLLPYFKLDEDYHGRAVRLHCLCNPNPALFRRP